MEKITAYLLIWLALCCVFVRSNREEWSIYRSLEDCESGCEEFCYEEQRHSKCIRLNFLEYQCKCTSQIHEIDYIDTSTNEFDSHEKPHGSPFRLYDTRKQCKKGCKKLCSRRSKKWKCWKNHSEFECYCTNRIRPTARTFMGESESEGGDF
jgi:hypothetical protein